MKRSSSSMDGFVPRRPERTASVFGRAAPLSSGRSGRGTLGRSAGTSNRRSLRPLHAQRHVGSRPAVATARPARPAINPQEPALRDSITSSLNAIDADTPETPRQRRKRRLKKRFKIKLALLVVGGIALIVGGFLLFKLWQSMGQILQGGNLLDLFQQQELKKDQHGRSNVLIVGTTEDDPNHGGAHLTDSMMVLSVDQAKKDAYMFSIPRDLYVKYGGKACNSGYAGKINEYFACAAEGDSEQAERQRMDAIRGFVGGIVGMEIQYVLHVNTLVIRDAVNSVGGVTVNVQSRDPRGVLDGSLDWMCRHNNPSSAERQRRCPTGHYIDFKNGPTEMDGDKAMWFSRARGIAPPTYGLEQSNFDREKNQQLVMVALKNKALSTGTLTDVGKITSLLDAMGKNLRTNIESKEIRTIMNLASEIKESDIHRLSFIEDDNNLMTTATVPGAGSVVQPTAGLYDYSDIQAFIQGEVYATPLSKEKATVAVLNGGAAAGKAQEAANQLRQQGIKVVYVGNYPLARTKTNLLHQSDAGKEKPVTRGKLETTYGVSAGGPVNFNLPVDAQFVVVLGSGS